MTAPYLGQIFDADTADVTPGETRYIIVRLAPDGSRRIVDSDRLWLNTTYPTWGEVRGFWTARWEHDPIMFWGEYDFRLSGRIAALAGTHFMPYPLADGIAAEPVDEPPNQIPYQQDFLNHCCTFAHELLVDHQPHASRLRHPDSWNLAPDIALDVGSIEQNRIGMRYYRGRLGYFYDRIVRFASHPNNPADVGQFEIDWRTELAEMQEIDRDVCGDCRDEAGGSMLRDFIHYCNVAEWDAALTAVEQVAIGVSVQYRARLPKIDRSNPDDLRPHRNQNVRTWVTNVPSVDSGWRSMMRDFDAAVKRYDRDTSVRMPSGSHRA